MCVYIGGVSMEVRPTLLSASQQKHLNEKKVAMRVANETYLRAHPEVNKLVNAFLAKVMVEHPDDVRAFAADFFTGDEPSKVVASDAAGAGAGTGAEAASKP